MTPGEIKVAETEDNSQSGSGTASTQGRGTSILVLTIVAAFLSFAVGGCTSIMGDAIAEFGDQIGEDATEIRNQAGSFLLYGLLEAVLGLVGGVLAYRNYRSAATKSIGGRSFKILSLAGTSIAAAAILSITNTLAFFTAGILNTIAATLTFLQSKRV